jgi:glutathione-regulated potassium-efflux system ancillary protein KefC
MALTPFLLLLFDKLMMPRINSRLPPPEVPIEMSGDRDVIVLGYGRFGQIVTRLLRAQGYSMTLIDDDPAQIELVKRYGVKVFYGDGGRLDILRAAGAAEAEMIVIAVAGAGRITDIATMIRRHFPNVKIAARAVDRSHAHDLMELGVETLERETFRAAVTLGRKALVALGHPADEAQRMADTFEDHDQRLLDESYALRGDRDAYVGFVRKSTEMLDQVMQADRDAAEAHRKDGSDKAAE